MIYSSFPHAQYEAHKKQINAAIQRVLDSGIYVLGPEVTRFESAFADYIGVRHGVGVNSGTDALILAMKAMDIGPGDEVITASHTAVPTVAAITNTGATAVLVDIEPGFYTIDPVAFENAITERTKAVVIVHLYGQAADLDALLPIAERHNIKVIEDCAQAAGARWHGKRLGSFGDVSCFSFYPTKNLGAIGDGGLIATNDENLAAKVRQLREYGWDSARNSEIPGSNSRLDEMQAAILNAKLEFLDQDNQLRREHAARYAEILERHGLAAPQCRKDAEHVYHLYVIETENRQDLMSHLDGFDIRAAVHYPRAVHQQTAYTGLPTPGGLDVTGTILSRITTLPMYPELPAEVFTNIEQALASLAK